MLHHVAAIVYDDIDHAIFDHDMIYEVRVILASDMDLDVFALVLLTCWIDVDSHNVRACAEVLLPHRK